MDTWTLTPSGLVLLVVDSSQQVQQVLGFLGESATLSPVGMTSQNFTSIKWLIWSNDTWIATYIRGETKTDHFWRYRGRLDLDTSSGHLKISDLTRADAMQYVMEMAFSGNNEVLYKVDLRVEDRDLQLSLDRFAAECKAAGMRISTSKSESMVLNRKRVECTLRVGDEILPQVEEFKYLGVLFTSEGRMEREIDRRIGVASAVMRTLHGSVAVKRELSQKAKLSIYQSIFVPALTCGHELWVVTERTRSRVQAAKMNFLRRVAGLSLRDRVRSSVIREELGVDPLLLRYVERSQMRWASS
ncbi:putative uncharacterized transposon-derived protein F52C9.6 [Merluccius polli]|uniref:Uncharacterized transposon-derived protein F52C9.6 n=1 Tax=Merluccius polli TaxID=89951 RepID=A0AA47N4Y5_MERPO|nr:putative uncharacterized transposon-derived protein F52C9.6 [Merluccius polli]